MAPGSFNSGLGVVLENKSSVQEKANFLVASLEQSLPLLELCTFKIILHTVAENVSNRHLRTAAQNTRKVFLGSNPGRQGQRQFV